MFEYGLYMLCVACMMFAHDVAVECAIAIRFIARSKIMQESISTCVCKVVWFVEYGLYMFCVACMIFAHDVAVTFAIALLFVFKNKKI